MLRRDRERGAVVVMVAILIVPIALLLAFAVDVGNWWVHKRHLQTQADAGALAAGLGPWLPVCDDNAITTKAREYASDLGGGWNPQYSNEANVHVLINSAAYWNEGGTDFSEDGKTPCQTLFDPATDPATGKPKPGYVDVKATEANLPNFFGAIPGFEVVPAINRRARIEIQKQGFGVGIRPIAVRDDTAFQCAEIVHYSVGDGAQIGAAITLARTTGPPTTAYTEFQNTAGTPVTMPSSADTQVYVRVRLYANVGAGGGCTGPYEEYPTDDSGSPVGGVSFINVYSAGSNPTPSDPFIRGVQLLNGGCVPDQYFTTGACNVSVSAVVEFAAGAITSGPDKNVFVRINGDEATNTGGSTWTAPFSFGAATGPHPFQVVAVQRFGSTSKGNCNNPNRCTFDFGVRQQTYSALDDDGEPSSSGPISLVQIGEGGPGVGANSFERNTTHTLVFTVRVTGLANSQPSDPPIVLRFPVQGSKRTGVVDCGQGNGANEARLAVENGCPRPVYVYPPATTCVTPTNSSPPTPIDCVGIVPGNRRQQIARGFANRVGNSCNNWNAYRDSNGTTTFPADDPRMVTFIITSPVDLSGSGGSNNDIPVLLFATFYVTGADGLPNGNGTGCQNERYPGTGNGRFAVWGHWIKWANAGGGGTGEACHPNEFGACVAVLTR